MAEFWEAAFPWILVSIALAVVMSHDENKKDSVCGSSLTADTIFYRMENSEIATHPQKWFDVPGSEKSRTKPLSSSSRNGGAAENSLNWQGRIRTVRTQRISGSQP